MQKRIHTDMNYSVLTGEGMIDPSDPSKGMQPMKVLIFTDPKTGIEDHYPLDAQEDGPAEKIGNALLDRRLGIASALSGPDGEPLDLRKPPPGA